MDGNGAFDLKSRVRSHWEAEPCGTRGLPREDRREFFRKLELERYTLEPYIKQFAQFEGGAGKRVLEVGVGAGTDFVSWTRSGANVFGVDLTAAGIALTRERLVLEGKTPSLQQADAEALPFKDESFDLVYSYGVLHHSPDTEQAIAEVLRVLRPGGIAKVMVYHRPSWTGLMLWVVHCAARGRPWRSVRWALAHHLESPGTKAYTKREARRLFGRFRSVRIRTQLSHGDLLLMKPSHRYETGVMRVLWRLYPRWLVRRTGNAFGLGLLVDATK